MHVLHVTSELNPYSKTGGLADMVGSLSHALADSGVEVTVVTPLYRGVASRIKAPEDPGWSFGIPMGDRLVFGRFLRSRTSSGLTEYFVDQPAFYDRGGIYHENRREYPDNAARYLFFSKAAVLLARYLPSMPEVIHGHDWQAGMVPLLLKEPMQGLPPGARMRTVLTVHNLAYSGAFPLAHWALTNLPESHVGIDGVEFFGHVSPLKAGLVHADALTTVSPHYSREIQTREFGCGLEGLLHRRRGDLVGILNGVDYREWRTQDNPHLPASFWPGDLAGKAVCKRELQREFGLPLREDVPLLGNVSRIEQQKGSDLIVEALRGLEGEDWQCVLLGSGDARLEDAYRGLAVRYPDRVSVRIGFDAGLAHRIEAGTDFFLMPSRFEPCGLNQMYSLRYGSLPIVRDTGGLHDSVVDAREDSVRANGIKFGEATPEALSHAIRKAMALWWNLPALNHFRYNAMTADFSWSRSAGEYVELYRRLASG